MMIAPEFRAAFRALEPSCEFEDPPALYVFWRTGVLIGERLALEDIREQLAAQAESIAAPADYGEIVDDPEYPVASPADLAVALTQEFREALLDVQHAAEPEAMGSAMADARRLIGEMGALAASMPAIRGEE